MARLRKLRISLEYFIMNFMGDREYRYKVIKDGLPFDSKIEEVYLKSGEVEIILSSKEFNELPEGTVPPEITPIFHRTGGFS